MKVFLDLDCFFLQCHAVESGEDLLGTACAVVQHGDLICLSYPARSLGLAKHASPEEARQAGVRLIHVRREYGSKVSYKLYRTWSRRIFAEVASVAQARGDRLVVHSIDEASIDVAESASRLLDERHFDSWGDGVCSVGAEQWSAHYGADMLMSAAVCAARAYREAIRSVGFVASACVAETALCAKAAVQKPDTLSVCAQRAAAAYLGPFAWRSLPYCGTVVDRVARERLLALGVETCLQLVERREEVARVLTERQLEWLLCACEGREAPWWKGGAQKAPVPRSVCVQMSLQPHLGSDLHKVWGWLTQEVHERLDELEEEPKMSMRVSARKLAEKEVGITVQRRVKRQDITHERLWKLFSALYNDLEHIRWVGVTLTLKVPEKVAKVSVLEMIRKKAKKK